MATDTITRTAGVVEHIDPQSIVIEANVRPGDTMKPLTKEFIENIRQNGVLMPVRGYRDEQGNVLVRAGQRRTLAAREAGVETIPVYIVDADQDTARRIIDQLNENEHRDALTDAERAAAWQQLAFEGMSVAAIAKRTGTKAAQVKQGIAVAENATANTAITEHDLDLEQAAVLIEFEGDEDATAKLIATAKERPSQFAHEAQRMRDARARAERIAKRRAEVEAAGFPILDREPGYWEKGAVRHTDLATRDGQEVTAKMLTGKEGVSAYVDATFDGVRVTYWVDDPKTLGLKRRRSDGSVSQPMTEEQKAERRELVANNAAWGSAETVRREWLASFFTRKTMPKDAIQFVARGLTSARMTVAHGMSNKGNAVAQQLLGLGESSGIWSPDKITPFVAANPTKAIHTALAVVVGGLEGSTGKTSWRDPRIEIVAYFEQLVAWGYTLSDVEQLVIDRHRERSAPRPAPVEPEEAPVFDGEDFAPDDLAEEYDYED